MSTPGEMDLNPPGGSGPAAPVDSSGSSPVEGEARKVQPFRVLEPDPSDATTEDRRRGLAIARRLSDLAEGIRAARGKVEAAPGGGRRRCIGWLERMWATTHALEQDALSASGSPTSLHEDLEILLADAEDLIGTAADRKRLKRRHVRRLRKEARHACRRLESVLAAQPSVN